MPRVALSQLPDWHVVDERLDLRGLRLLDEAGNVLGLILEMVVDTGRGEVDALVLDTGAEIPADDVEIGRDIVIYHPARPDRVAAPRVQAATNPARAQTRQLPAKVDVPPQAAQPPRETRLPGPFEEAAFEIPIRVREFFVEKRAVVVEEVHLRRSVSQRIETIRENVHSVHVDVQEQPPRQGIGDSGRDIPPSAQ